LSTITDIRVIFSDFTLSRIILFLSFLPMHQVSQ